MQQRAPGPFGHVPQPTPLPSPGFVSSGVAGNPQALSAVTHFQQQQQMLLQMQQAQTQHMAMHQQQAQAQAPFFVPVPHAAPSGVANGGASGHFMMLMAQAAAQAMHG